MKYTPEQREKDINHIIAETRKIRDDRGERYCSSEDTLHNVRVMDWYEPDGWRGAMQGAIECLNRIMVMAPHKTADIDCKDFENATDDLLNFTLFMKIMERQKRISIATPCEEGDCGKGVKTFDEMKP